MDKVLQIMEDLNSEICPEHKEKPICSLSPDGIKILTCCGCFKEHLVNKLISKVRVNMIASQ